MTPGSSFARPLILSGADVVLPDRVLSPGTVIVEDGRVTAIETGARSAGSGAGFVDLHGHILVAGFIDVHVHGVEGFDSLDSVDAVEEIARRLVRYGVTAFCPTSVACPPAVLERLIESMRRARASARPHARVLPAHLESNFISADFRGAQPLDCLRRPPRLGPDGLALAEHAETATYSGADVLRVIEAHRRDVGIVTMAVELDGGLDLAKALVAAGHRVSLGHSAATYEQALAGIAAGARHATHLFNRMSPLGHRAPGLTGATLTEDAVAAEIICDGYHVHPAVATAAIRAKRVERMMAITDGSAGAGLPVGSKVSLGGRAVTVTEDACFLDDGTLCGSRITMDGAFRRLLRQGFSPVEASRMCSGTQAAELGLSRQGVIVPGALADLAVLDRQLEVATTYVGGVAAWARAGAAA
ncbi:MAG TPA: N-acetylglucosamine-6-phosphate deacetylase [Vicinamibacterales bacterium]|nr:N-acetylglucosamine-6-phosphate deacetylase [Vicinamibacterales bacterium]